MHHAKAENTVKATMQSTHLSQAHNNTASTSQLRQASSGAGVVFAPPRTASKVKVTWAKLKRRVGNGSAPDDSLGDPTTATDATSDGGSSFGRGRRGGGSQAGNEKLDEKPELDQVDEVVVEATGSPEFWRTAALPSHNGSNKDGNGTGTGTNGLPPGLQSEGSSLRHTAYEASGVVGTVGNFLRWRIWPRVHNFFSPSYHDKSVEDLYQKEVWYTSKSTAIFGACFLVLQWVLLVSLLVKPWSLFNKVNNYLVAPLLNVPLVVLAAFDAPRRKPKLWQAWLFCAVVMASIANLIDMKLCGYYTPTPRCGRKDFQATLFYVCSGPTVALFALGLKRIVMVVISLIWFVLAGSLILQDRASFVRNMINVIIFHGFIIFTHYMREMSDRRMYTMRAELKTQFKAKQRAQISERKTLDAKRRFSSYIFHEVRVPLNTALLAVQNMTHSHGFNHTSETAEEFAALEGSLQMMSQVLNDVLDYTRMERGGFSSVSRPFSLHNTMRSIFAPLRIDTNARGLALEVSLDPRIDFVAHRAAYFDDYVDNDGNPKKDLPLLQEGDGYMCGDEMRLRQVINNLASNAAKFTPAGGKITIRTSLVYPIDGYPRYDTTAQELTEVDHHTATESDRTVGNRGLSDDPSSNTAGLSEGRLQQHEGKTNGRVRDNILVARIEVEDTGVGIRARDMAEARLFSAYVQTEIGKKQGGKGTGLGLSLVRQIVMLSGGRLGVKSKVGQGSTFWVELPFAIGPETRQVDQFAPHRRISSTLDKDLTPSSGATGSDASEYRFVPVLNNDMRQSDAALRSINESDKNSFTMPHRTSSASSGPSNALSPALTSPPLVSPPAAFLALDAPPPVFPVTGPGSIVTSTPITRTGDRVVSAGPDTEELTRPPNLATLSTSSAPPAPQTAPASSSPSTTLSRSSALGFPDGPLKVLVVDDDALTRKLMARLLTRLGCVISTAENGAIALEMMLDQRSQQGGSSGTIESSSSAAEGGASNESDNPGMGIDPRHVSERNFDVVFLDNQMPICSGLQVVSRMRSLGRDDLIVGITANALIADQEEYVERGASAVLTKPVLEVDLRKYLIKADRIRAERKLNLSAALSDSAASTPRTSFAVPRRV